MRTRTIHLICACVLLATGCKLPNDGAIDVSAPPHVGFINVTPAVWNVPLRSPNDTASTVERIVTVKSQIQVESTGLPIARVRCDVIAPDGTVLLSDQELRDDGVAPDVTANDGWYTRQCRIQTSRTNLGAYSFRVTAFDNAGTQSNDAAASLVMRIQLTSQNYLPVLGSIDLPDIITVPPAGQTNLVGIAVAVLDSNGVDDIASVKVAIIRVPENSVVGTYEMYDDGGTVIYQPFGLPSGDETAGDGAFTLLLPVPSSTNKNMYRDFQFTATDRSGAEAAPKIKRVYFR